MASKPDSKLDPAVQAAKATLESDATKGIAQLRTIIAEDSSESDVVKRKEQAITCLTGALADKGDAESLKQLLADLKPMFANMPKAKTAKIVRTVMDALAQVPNTAKLQVCAVLVTTAHHIASAAPHPPRPCCR